MTYPGNLNEIPLADLTVSDAVDMFRKGSPLYLVATCCSGATADFYRKSMREVVFPFRMAAAVDRLRSVKYVFVERISRLGDDIELENGEKVANITRYSPGSPAWLLNPTVMPGRRMLTAYVRSSLGVGRFNRKLGTGFMDDLMAVVDLDFSLAGYE